MNQKIVEKIAQLDISKELSEISVNLNKDDDMRVAGKIIGILDDLITSLKVMSDHRLFAVRSKAELDSGYPVYQRAVDENARLLKNLGFPPEMENQEWRETKAKVEAKLNEAEKLMKIYLK